MSNAVVRQVSPNVWTFSKPFARFGCFPVGGRSTAITLANGGVWILASTPLEGETKTKLDELGDVRYIVGASKVHWMYLNDYKKAYPHAKVIGVEPLLKKNECPKLDGAYGHDPLDTKYGFEDEITPCYFSGCSNKDVAFFHASSKTLVVADLVLNLPANEQYSELSHKPALLRFSLGPTGWVHRAMIQLLAENKEAMKRDAQKVASWEFTTIIPCHGDVIEDKANEAWRAAYKPFL